MFRTSPKEESNSSKPLQSKNMPVAVCLCVGSASESVQEALLDVVHGVQLRAPKQVIAEAVQSLRFGEYGT